MEMSGHSQRLSDLDCFVAAGVRVVRYPILWERTAPRSLDECHWEWSDARLARLKELGLGVIAGLVHHGSGPIYTDLLDPHFPEKLARYALAVAERYPWLEHFTPVNEPLTTARFSGLYGHWYPHHCNEQSFLRCLVNQCKGIILAMQQIRRVNPRALLVQTEDLGQTFCTPSLAYQAEFDNERRWLSHDLICGRVGPEHVLHERMLRLGIGANELDFFVQNAMPPDILGINHYITSDRFLDERIECHPPALHGGNGRDRYVDLEAVRALDQDLCHFGRVVEDAWKRYHLPVALTEVHIGCTREEQMRWLQEAWQCLHAARERGIGVRAMTAWAFFGLQDWDSLITQERGHYEPGVYDVRNNVPRPTAIVGLLRSLSEGSEPRQAHLLTESGWWHRRDRFLQTRTSVSRALSPVLTASGSGRPLLITGARGTLGSAFARFCLLRGLSYRLLTRAEMDIASPVSVERAIREFRPWAIINAAGFVRVDAAETEPQECWRENTLGPCVLAEACTEHRVRLLTFSSDLVFDGRQAAPYLESDGVAPLNVYGRTKAQAEQLVLDRDPSALVIRTSAFFGPWDHANFVTHALLELRHRGRFSAVKTVMVSPTYVPDLVNASLDLLIDGERGILHVANRGAVTWLELASMAAEAAGLRGVEITGHDEIQSGWTAPRPRYSVLGSEFGQVLPGLDNALERYVEEVCVTGLMEAQTAHWMTNL